MIYCDFTIVDTDCSLRRVHRLSLRRDFHPFTGIGKKVDRHNHLVERMYRAEMRIRRMEEKMEEGARYE